MTPYVNTIILQGNQILGVFFKYFAERDFEERNETRNLVCKEYKNKILTFVYMKEVWDSLLDRGCDRKWNKTRTL
jgi:hypothetical protein